MASSLRDLRRKIKSVRSTQKITSAMQLVAASKMQRATRRALESRVYTEQLTELVTELTGRVDPSHQTLFASRPVKTILVLLITTNRGLAGALNTQLIRQVFSWRDRFVRDGVRVNIAPMGAKGRAFVNRYAQESLVADFPAPDIIPHFTDASSVTQFLLDEFGAGRADQIFIAYNYFQSTLRQEPRIIQYLPFSADQSQPSQPSTLIHEKLFEPDQETILTALVPRVLRSRLYQMLLEAHASEQSARMIAMKNATDNADDLLGDLQLTYNSFRQAAITGELLDIAAGASALAS